MDRPSRKTKVVNYSEVKDFEDDDEDFACSKGPPSKKQKEEPRQEQKKSVKCSSQETNPKSTQSEKSRKPRDEKLYERDLEAAITLSLLNNSDEPPIKRDVKHHSINDENTDPSTLHLSNCSVNGAILGLDIISSEKGSPAPAGRRKTSPKAAETQKKNHEDEDYEPKLTPDSESDEAFSEPSETEDEEFTVKKARKDKKEKATKKDKNKAAPAPKKEKKSGKALSSKHQAAAVSKPVRTPSTKITPTRPVSSCVASASKAANSLSPAGGRIPKWNPPAQIGKSGTSPQTPSVKSPSQGLRLGLSRLVRVKPLHPSVSSH